jgi:DNA-binding FadR family transcriptional regulator
MSVPNVVRQTLTDQVCVEFRRRIRDRELSPGDRLPTEKELTASLQVSRTVVREAVARLSAEGLVKARHGMGVFVTESARHEAFQITAEELATYEEVGKLLELRLAVETEMAGLAAARRSEADVAELRRLLAAIGADNLNPDASVDADAALHLAIARAAQNEYFERFLTFLGARLVPKRSLIMRGKDDARSRSLMNALQKEHEAIVEAIASKHSPAARAAARRHLANSLLRHRQVAALRDLKSLREAT